jgi:hypothetical protein
MWCGGASFERDRVAVFERQHLRVVKDYNPSDGPSGVQW